MVTNRKGWKGLGTRGVIHTLEAMIALLIVLSASYMLYADARDLPLQQTPKAAAEAATLILGEISLNQSLRQCLISSSMPTFSDCRSAASSWPCLQNVISLVERHTPAGFQSACEVCDPAISCITTTILPTDRDLYVHSALLAGNPSRVFRVYTWQR